MVGPKSESDSTHGMRYHAKDAPAVLRSDVWAFEEKETSMMATNAQLVRVVIGKVTNSERLIEILRNVPVIQNDSTWNCVAWVRDALQALRTDGKAIGTRQLDWVTVRDKALAYCEEKKTKHRFDGQGRFDMKYPATYDLLIGKETIA